jgi:chaperone LolA
MKKNFKTVALLMMIFICYQSVSLSAADNKAEEIIKKVKDEYDDLKTFYAEFSQSSYWKLADNVHEQKGKIWLKGKDKFKIETEDQTIVCDSKTIWTYSQFNNQVIIDKVEKSGEEIRLPKDIFFKYSEDYNLTYIGDEKIDNQDCSVLELRAKTEDIFIKYMKIWINKKISIPIKIEQVDINNNSNNYLIMNVEINKAIDDNFFVYKVPDSVEIIDMR